MPCESDEDLPPPEVLLVRETITLAETVHVPPLGKTHTFCASARLDETLLDARTVPAVSLTEVPPLNNEVLSWSRS